MQLFRSKHLISILRVFSSKIIASNLPERWNEEDLRKRFEKSGEIEKIVMMKNSTGIFTGNG